MTTGATNIERFKQLLPPTIALEVSLNQRLIQRLWKLQFDSSSELEQFTTDLSPILQDELIPIEQLPIYQLYIWHQKLKEALVPKSEIAYVMYEQVLDLRHQLSFTPDSLAFWKVTIKLFRNFDVSTVVLLTSQFEKTDGLSVGGLYKLTFLETKALLLMVEKKIQDKNHSFLALAFKWIPVVHDPIKLTEIISGFITKILPLFKQKIGKDLYIIDSLIDKWFGIYMKHQYTALLRNSDDNPWKQLSHVPFPEIIRNVPSFLWYFLLNCSDQDQTLILHLAGGNNIRSLSPFQELPRATAHFFVKINYGTLIKEGKGFPTNKLHDFRYAFAYFQSHGLRIEEFQTLSHFNMIPSGDFSLEMMANLQNCKIIATKFQAWFAEDTESHNTQWEILSYVQHCKDENIAFSLQGRTLKSTMRIIVDWQKSVQLKKTKFRSWEGADYIPWEEKKKNTLFTIVQLTDSNQLIEEAFRMNHCVSSYAKACKKGKISIWSLRKTVKKKTTSLLTMEVNKKGKIVQAKGVYNAAPDEKARKMMKAWAEVAELRVGKRV